MIDHHYLIMIPPLLLMIEVSAPLCYQTHTESNIHKGTFQTSVSAGSFDSSLSRDSIRFTFLMIHNQLFFFKTELGHIIKSNPSLSHTPVKQILTTIIHLISLQGCF